MISHLVQGFKPDDLCVFLVGFCGRPMVASLFLRVLCYQLFLVFPPDCGGSSIRRVSSGQCRAIREV